MRNFLPFVRISFVVIFVFSLIFIQNGSTLALSYSWSFDQSSDFSFNASTIQVTSGTAQLVEAANGWWNASYKYRLQLTLTDGRTAASSSLNGAINAAVTTITVNDASAFPQSPTLLIENEQVNCGQKSGNSFTTCARGANGTTAAAHASGVTASLVLPTGYSVEIASGTANPFYAKTQTDGDDWRVVYWNGSTWSELDRDLVTYTATAYDAWFKTQAPVAAGGNATAYYAYYGNANAATPTVNRNNVYALYEQFTYADGALANWSASSGTWEINSNAYRQTVTSGSNLYSTYDNLNLYDFVIQADVTIVSGRTAGLSFRVDNGFGGEPYYAVVDSTLDQLRLLCTNCGAIATYATTIDNGTTYTIRVASLDDNYKVSLNGTQRINATDPDDAFNVTTNGELGFQTFQTHARFDNLKIRMYVGVTEPTFSVGVETTRYPTDDPTIQPIAALAQPFTTIATFSETATKSGGEIRYLLSNDGGASWLFWNGSTWATSNGTISQTTTAGQAHTQRATFPVGTGSFLFKAFFDSDGTQFISLDSLSLTTNNKPQAPTASAPADAATGVSTTPTFSFAATDPEADALLYQLQIDTVNTFTSANLQTVDQTVSQIGWTGQDANGGAAYASGSTASVTRQTALAPSATYYWRVRAKDVGGANAFGDFGGARSFTTLNDLTITQIQATAITPTGATISWTTSRTATSVLEYGTTTGYGQSVTDGTARTTHIATLTGLTAEMLYHYRVTATDTLGQTRTSSDATFTATANTLIANIAATVLSPSTATVTWTTNHLASSEVRYGETAAYGATVSVETAALNHAVALTGLKPKTTYHFQAVSVGNSTAASADATFRTPAPLGAPTLTAPADGAQVIETRPRLFGFSRSNHDVFLVLDGSLEIVVKATNHPSGTGSFSFTPRRDLALGTHTVYVVSRAPNGDISENSPVTTFTVIHPSIAPTLFAPLVRGGDNPTLEIRGLAANDSIVELFLDGSLVAERHVGWNPDAQTIAFSVCLETRNLADGAHTLTARASDLFGKPSRFTKPVTFDKISEREGDALETPETQLTADVVYEVQPGDSLWAIASRFFGDGRVWQRIADANTGAYPTLGTNPSVILPGWRFLVPSIR